MAKEILFEDGSRDLFEYRYVDDWTIPIRRELWGMSIDEFRKKYPQYDNRTDLQLARALHAKYFRYISFVKFAERFGVKRD